MLKIDNFRISTDYIEEIMGQILKIVKTSKKARLISTINANSFVIAQKDRLFNKALAKSDILIPDGASISIASRLFRMNYKLRHRVSGPDLFENFNKIANQHKLTYYFLGSTDDVLDKIKKRLKREFPGIKAYFHSPPMYPFEEKENKKIIREINKIKPDILWVGMTAPKQEKWSYENKDFLKVKIICSIGAAFDFYAGTLKRAPRFMQKHNLEWSFRLIKEPKRTYKRYINNNIMFAWNMFKLSRK